VDWATANGTASAPSDYLANSGTLTFAAGQTTRTITVVVNGDTFDEADETFFVNLSNAVNAGISVGQGVGTILDDDPPPSMLITDAVVSEGNSGTTTNLVFQVRLSTASGKTVSVDYATANGTATVGSDYQPANGTLTFPPGTILQTVNVTVNGDNLVEPDETVLVNLSNVANATIGRGQGVGKILDDDELPSLTVTDASVTEGDSGTTNAVFTVLLSFASSQTVTVVDTTAPTITCAAAKSVECGTAWTFDAPTTSDTCGSSIISNVGTTTNALCGNTFSAIKIPGLGDIPIRLNVTGCPNGCARPYTSEIGIVGRGGTKYTLYIGGDTLGRRLNTELQDSVPFEQLAPKLKALFTAFGLDSSTVDVGAFQ
jgi:hypothetical protein